MLFDEIKKASMNALKERNVIARNIYGVIINKCQLASIEKRAKNEELNDADVLQILQKVVKELNEEKENYLKVNNIEEVNNIDKQLEVVKSYLPSQLNEEEIKNEINKLDDKSIGSVMRHFKTNFSGRVDMSLVQSTLKNM